MTHSNWKRQLWLIISLVVVVLLAAAVFTLGSLNIPLRPEQGNAFVILFALSTFIAAALLVFTLILTRSLLRLWSERKQGADGFALQSEDGFGCVWRFSGCLSVPFLFQLCACLQDDLHVVPAPP